MDDCGAIAGDGNAIAMVAKRITITTAIIASIQSTVLIDTKIPICTTTNINPTTIYSSLSLKADNNFRHHLIRFAHSALTPIIINLFTQHEGQGGLHSLANSRRWREAPSEGWSPEPRTTRRSATPPPKGGGAASEE